METDVAGLISASKPATLTHVITPFGPAIRVNASGSLKVGVEADSWGGTLSLDDDLVLGQVRLRLQAADDFLISIAIEYSYDRWSEKSNIFGAKEGMWGGSITELNASGMEQSRSNWTVIDGEEHPIFYDAIGNASRDGVIISLIGCPLGVGVIMIGRRKRDIDPDD